MNHIRKGGGGEQFCPDPRGWQITPHSPVLTEVAWRHKPQRLKILNVKNTNNIFNLNTFLILLIKNLYSKLQAYVLMIYIIVIP
jgi:hypothetical protein